MTQQCVSRPTAAFSRHTARRYGSLSQHSGQKYRFHEYYLISYDPVRDCYVEDRCVTLVNTRTPSHDRLGFPLTSAEFCLERRRVTLFHVMLPLSEVGPIPDAHGHAGDGHKGFGARNSDRARRRPRQRRNSVDTSTLGAI